MRTEIEVAKLSRKHEDRRQKSESREKHLFLSIAERGIEEPLQGSLSVSGEAILLDGFKRLRCAIKLGIGAVPFISVSDDEAGAILLILKTSNAKALTMLEQAAFVEELKSEHGLSVGEIAKRLERSKAWVLVRLKAREEMSEATAKSILSGKFPFYSYFYTLHPFTRVTGVASKQEVDEFVSLTSGRGLSTRDIELLSNAYFRGGDSMKSQIKNGDIGWCLQQMKEQRRASDAVGAAPLSESERRSLRDLETLQGCMARLSLKLTSVDMKSPSFMAQAELMSGGILERIEGFSKIIRGFYDRIRQA